MKAVLVGPATLLLATAITTSSAEAPDAAGASALPPVGGARSLAGPIPAVKPSVLPTGLLTAAAEDGVTRGFLEVMDLIYAGRIVDAAERVEELVALAPDDPRPYLLKARLMREYVSEQDNTRENVKPQIEPILAVLDIAEEKSDALLERDPESLAGRLYRGWTKMFRGQLHELAFQHWSAGRSAKAGKGDLDRVLEQDPDNPDALMIVGTYLYFADLLPGVLKIASFLLRIPSGDREEGLELLERAEGIRSYSQYDARGMRGAILFGFEGELEEASALFDAFDRRFPDNPRLVEPLAVLDLWFVERLGSGLARVKRVVQANEGSPDPLARELTCRLRLYQAWIEIVAGHVEDGRANLIRLHREDPGRPDWFRPIVDLSLADVSLLWGDAGAAVRLHDEAKEAKDDALEELLRWVGEPGVPATTDDVARLGQLQPVAQALYAGRLDEAAAGLDRLPGDDPLVSFYHGELRQLRGDLEGALPRYERLLEPDVPARCRLFRRIARLRVAEIHAHRGEWEEAAAAFEDEIERYDVKDMLRHVVRARQRYFVREAQRSG